MRRFPFSVCGCNSDAFSSVGRALLGISSGASKGQAENTSSLSIGSELAYSQVSACRSGGRGNFSASSFSIRRCLFCACPGGTTIVAVFFLSRGLIGLVKCFPGQQDVAGSLAREVGFIIKKWNSIAMPSGRLGRLRGRLGLRRKRDEVIGLTGRYIFRFF